MRRLASSLDTLRSDIVRTITLFDNAGKIAGVLGLTARDAETYQSICLVRLTLAWESFLEDVLTKHMCGCQSVSGNHLSGSSGITSQMAALAALMNGRRFLSWNYDAAIRNIRDGLGGGHQWISDIQANKATLEEIYVVRNRIAHRSHISAVAFRSTVFGRFGYNPRGMTPGRYIRLRSPPYPTLMHDWTANLEAVATAIAN